MTENQLGVFKDFWDGIHPHHLPLMNLRGDTNNENWNVEISLKRIEAIFKAYEKEKVIEDMELLIKQVNWRPQLLFCISLLKLKKEEQPHLLEMLWNKLEEYRSWVIPQLAVTASIVDSNFSENAKRILTQKTTLENLEARSSEELMVELSRSNTEFEDKSSIAISWKERLLKLIEAGKIKPNS